jgi:osmotically-inducible protein OsmY
MSTTTDNSTREAVLHELQWDPQIDATHIGVVANDGAVALSGHVSTYAHRYESVRAAERVYGVRAVADDIEVKVSGDGQRSDDDIAETIARQFKWHSAIPVAVKADVLNGHVSLHGTVNWGYQRDEAARVVRYIVGVKSVDNVITVAPHAPRVTDLESRVGQAIERLADLDARSIRVTELNGRVQLHGHVHSFSEKRAASRSAAGAPGVTEVDKEIFVTP